MYSFYFNKSNISNIAIDNSNKLHDILDYILKMNIKMGYLTTVV